MAATFIPGYLAAIKLGTDDIETISNSGTLTLTKNILTKAVAGAKSPTVITGQRTGTLSVSGHISKEDLAKLNTAWDSDAVLAFEWQIGEASGATDAGKYTGNLLVESFATAFAADGEWDFTLDGVTSGDVTYVAPTP